MENVEDLFNLINKSTITLVGYSFKDEMTKDELISNFNYVEIKEINSSFSIKPILRDIKIQSVLDKRKSPDFILIDTNNILYDSEKIGSRRQSIHQLTEKLRGEVYSDIGEYPQKPKIKIIMTQPIHQVYEGEDIMKLTGGDSAVYASDLVVIVNNGKIKLVKNRFGIDGHEIPYLGKHLTKI